MEVQPSSSAPIKLWVTDSPKNDTNPAEKGRSNCSVPLLSSITNIETSTPNFDFAKYILSLVTMNWVMGFSFEPENQKRKTLWI